MRRDPSKDAAADEVLDWLAGSLDAAAAAEVERRLEADPAARREAEELRRLWEELALLSDELPGPSLRPRFDAMLSAHREDEVRSQGRRRAFWRWPSRGERSGLGLGLRVGYTAAVLALGALLGVLWRGAEEGNGQVSELRREVESLSELVALSLLRQQSASDRIQGAGFSERLSGSDPRVLDALLAALNRDPNATVRLAAIDALTRFAALPAVRSGLVEALPRQESPLVVVRLADLLLRADGRRARQAVEDLLRGKELDPTVREYLETRLSGL